MKKNIPLYILKLGGSVITHKDRSGSSVKNSMRYPLLEKIARTLEKITKNNSFQLILIHGAGSPAHQLAHKYKLKGGVKKDRKKLKGSLFLQNVNQNLDNALVEIFLAHNLNITPIHTASVIIQENKKIIKFYIETIKKTLENNCIPILYGEMVFDNNLGMSVCSGDAITAYLATKLSADKILFASDIDGIFTKDPHFYKDARLIEKILLRNIREDKNIELSKSHNIDVSDGLIGKINNLDVVFGTSVKSIEIFNGLDEKNYEKALAGKTFKHTTIKL